MSGTRRTPDDRQIVIDQNVAHMYRRTLTYWAWDLLQSPSRPPRWPKPEPPTDLRKPDWRLLYAGSILDD